MNSISHNDDMMRTPLKSLFNRTDHRNTRLARKILTPTLFIIAFLIVGFFAYSFLNARAENQSRELEDSQQAEKIFTSEINRLGDFALGLAIEAANNPEIQAAFAAHDRAKLMQLTLDGYLALDETFNIPQYQYHLPPATSFLRLHSTEKFGDDLSSFRFTVLQVNESKKPVVGLEVGRGGLGLRGIEPVFYNGSHIGSVEFGLNIDQELVANLKKEYGYDWRIILTRDALSLATLEDIAALQEGPDTDLLVLASTIDGVFPDPELYSQALNGEREIAQVSGVQNQSYSVTVIPLYDYSGIVIGTVDVIFDRTNIIQTQNGRLLTLSLAGLAALALGAFSLIFSTNRSLRPLEELTKAAEAVQQGNLNQQVRIANRDEIGILAKSFNAMTEQIRGLVGSLEQRVADRTKALETSTEISRRLTAILDQRELASEVVNQVQTAFNYYYAQIYLFDERGENLVLTAGTGKAGAEMMKRGHALPKGHGLVGRAAENNQPVLVTDTLQDPDWLPNDLLPETKAEAAVPIALGNLVLGVLDVQDDVTNDITSDDITLLESLASQVAISLQNARSFTEVQHSQEQLAEALNISRLANWEYDLEQDIFTFNDQFYSLFRTTVEKVGGYKLSSADYARLFVHPEDAPIVGMEIQKVLESKERHFSTSVEHRAIFDNGETGYFSVRVNVERDEKGRVIRWYGANQDVTERKRLEELNRKRAAQQEAINLITQRIQSATTIEEAMQVTARELGHALGNRQTLVALESSALGGNGKANVTE